MKAKMKYHCWCGDSLENHEVNDEDWQKQLEYWKEKHKRVRGHEYKEKQH